ncbi:MAG: D-tyrosyl-tRNA(Tyr) deacylase [Deltaproteobacteria bacterium]|nr:D-tyrosyl-tRNA(Tyr) deacylase [Deltaproteobacteria bacterium]
MRLVVQRVREASVTVGGESVAAIGGGVLVLAGMGHAAAQPETWPKIEAALAKLPVLRIFPDDHGHMNVSLTDYGGEILLVSQFTLYADCRKGRRPSFHLACPPDIAGPLFEKVLTATEKLLPGRVRSGIFAADMDVALTNWGPVTILLDSDDF